MPEIKNERTEARDAYNWLRISPLLTVPTFFFIQGMNPGFALVCSGNWNDCNYSLAYLVTALLAILFSAAWHLILLPQMGGAKTEFVRWHFRQALMLAGIRTAIPVFFLFLEFATDSAGLTLWAILALILAYFIGNDWGRKQAMRGECWLMTWRGYEYHPSPSTQMGTGAPEEERVEVPTVEANMTQDNSIRQIQKETLNEILEDLKSGESTRQLAAIQRLELIRFSSGAIVVQLEQLALHQNEAVSAAAFGALSLETSQVVSSNISRLDKINRQILLAEIKEWERDGLIESNRAEILRHRYDFDLRSGTPVKAATPVPAAPLETATPARIKMEPPAPTIIAPAQPAPRPAEPKPTLTQVLLSETSVRIYLYLGAFLVIAAAAILAALVEAARLPVLLTATVLFAGGAVGLKTRLPQPSFALAIVFSFLLPIDANVIADSLAMRPAANELYWTIVFLFMALIWALGTWFYASRLFSLTAFFSLTLATLRFGEIFDAPTDWNILSVALANLVGLAGARFLKIWKDQKFAQPLFLMAQLLQAVLLFVSLTSVTINAIEGTDPDNWIAAALTWLLAASFYVASDLFVPFLFFPWLTGASLFPLPWLALSAFDASPAAQAIGFAAWGVLAAFGSEIVLRREFSKKYHFPLLALSPPLFLTSITWGLAEDIRVGFAVLLATAVAYTLVNLPRPRVYVWFAALLAGLGAYFTFFALPFMEKADVYPGFTWLGASLLLLLPELFFKEPLTSKRVWNWPPVALGISSLLVCIAIALETSYATVAIYRQAIISGMYALLFAAYALRLKQPTIGYLGVASAAISLDLTLWHFDLDWWRPALTALAVLYYAAGTLLARREQTKRWAAMLIHSGLALGALVSFVAVFTPGERGGWDALIVAGMFALEMFTRRNTYLELGMESMLTVALVLFLGFSTVSDSYHFFGASLIWLGSDMALNLSLPNRRIQIVPRVFGALLTVFAVSLFASLRLPVGEAALCMAAYALFFAVYAWTYRRPWLGYFAAASAAHAVYFALDHFNSTQWLPVFTGLTVAYYAAGFLLFEKKSGWGAMFRYSGLALGALTTLVALVRLEPSGGWYALAVGALFIVETATSRDGWFEAGVHPTLGAAAFLILRDFNVDEDSYILLALSLVWLTGDMLFERFFVERKLGAPVRVVGHMIAGLNALALFVVPPTDVVSAVCFGAYAAFYALYAWMVRQPAIAYASTSALALALFFGWRAADLTLWILPMIGLASLYYLAGFFLRRADQARAWNATLLFSGLGLGSLVACASPFQTGGLEKAIPIALAATFFAAEAFARKNVWLGFPANALYLAAYFVILHELKVDETQFFTVGAAALGMFQHYLLRRAGSKSAAFITGLVSQLVLLGASYIQMVDTGELKYFFVLFFQSLVVLGYGAMFIRSRSLTIAPIGFLVLAIVTILYNALKDLSLVFIIGITGIILLLLGILAVVMRERITDWAERFGDWDA